jgi:hypothetical protein
MSQLIDEYRQEVADLCLKAADLRAVHLLLRDRIIALDKARCVLDRKVSETYENDPDSVPCTQSWVPGDDEKRKEWLKNELDGFIDAVLFEYSLSRDW